MFWMESPVPEIARGAPAVDKLMFLAQRPGYNYPLTSPICLSFIQMVKELRSKNQALREQERKWE